MTPDGRVLFSPGAADLMVLALDGTHRVEEVLKTPSVERNGVVSPNGRWLAYESDSSGRFEIYVRPFPIKSPEVRQISMSEGSTQGSTRPLCARNGQELFYVAPGGALMAVPVDTRAGTWSAGSPAKVLEGPYVTESPGRTSRSYDVSVDGQRFLMVKQPTEKATTQIVVVQNWLEELRRLVPATH